VEMPYGHMLCPVLLFLLYRPPPHQFDGIIIINAAGIIMMINGVSGDQTKRW